MNKTNERIATWPLVETSWLAEHLDSSDLRIIDCSIKHQDHDIVRKYFSGKVEWEKAHIPGSVYVNSLTEIYGHDATRPYAMPTPEKFAATMESIGIDDDTQVVLYDNSDHAWAAFIWWMLRVIGIDSAVVLNGGLQKWQAEQRPVTTEAKTYPEGSITRKYRPELMATRQRVLSELHNDEVTIIHALTPDEFSGKYNRFPRPGRISGSVNVNWETLVNKDTYTYLSEKELRGVFNATDALKGNSFITYCGGGVAASSDALALTLLDIQDVAVYHEGLIEWTADPELPMEVG